MEAKMATVYLIVALLIAVVAVIFALQNSITVTISFLTWEVTGSLSLVLLITLAIGALIGLLVLAPTAIKNTLTASNNRKRIGILEKELDEQKLRIADLEKPRPAVSLPEPARPDPAASSSTEPPQSRP
jgi:putative membrane protein